MNIILDTLPETVTVNGREFFIDTDFRTFIIMEKTLLDEKISSRDRVDSIIDLLYTDEVPVDKRAAIGAAVEIYQCGAPQKAKKQRTMNGNTVIRPKLIYDFIYDAPYIYGAFRAQYGIDLNDIEYLHWWKFDALFRSLNSCHKIVEIMSYRATDLSKVENPKERSRIARLQEQYALPDGRTREEKVAMAGAAFGGGMF